MTAASPLVFPGGRVVAGWWRQLPPPPPPLLPLRLPAESPWPAPEGWAFDPGWLDACLRQPEEWKRERGFPVEARRVLGVPARNGGPVSPLPAGEAAPAWRQVILDRP